MMTIKESLLGVLLLNAAGAFAANDAMSVANIEVPQGGSVELTIALNNETANLSGWQCDLGFSSDGLSLTLNAGGKPEATLSERFNTTGHSISSRMLSNGSYRFVVTSNDGEAIPGSSGVLFSVTLEADASLEVGKTYEGTLYGIEFYTNDETPQTILMNDVTFTVTIGEPDDGRIKFDENAAKLPTYTAGDKANVRMTRTIKANQWSTIVLPFTLTKTKAETVFGSDVQLAEFSGFEVEYENDEDVTPDAITINFTTYTMTARKGMTGGKPFLIKTTQDIASFEADDCTLVGEVADVEKADEYETPGTFTGTFVKTVVPADALFISGEKFYYSTGKTNIKAFRGWFQLGAVLDKETDFGVKMAVFIDDEATDIKELDGLRNSNDLNDFGEATYNLAGQRVGDGYKGIVVTKGRKIIK